ncbi:MAG TPA: hypothetical protein GXX15_08335 [Clostridia bacterium]|nr:hypothetical protein [Clostridia bacterium]
MKKAVKIAIILLIVIYIGKMGIRTFANKDKVTLVTYGNIAQQFETQAYIIRNEMIINSPLDGKVKRLIANGVRVAKGTPIAQIYSADFDEKKIQELEEVTKKLKSEDTNVPFYSDIQKLDEMIKREQDNYQKVVAQNGPDAEKIKKRIASLQAKKEEILSKGPSVLQKIESLKEQKEFLENYIGNNTITIDSPEGGIVSYYFNGNEEILNEKNMFNLRPKELENLDWQTKELDLEVKKDLPFVKIVDNFTWYLALVLKEEEQEFLKENDEVKILIEDYSCQLRGKVIKLYRGDDKLYIGLIEMRDCYPDFYKKDKVKVTVKLREYRGLKVPLSAIVKEEGKEGVFVIKNNKYPIFKEIIIRVSDGKYAIVESGDKISGLRLYDEIATNGEKYIKK